MMMTMNKEEKEKYWDAVKTNDEEK